MSDDGWTWELSSTAEDDLDGLSPADQDRILDKLDEIVSSPWRDPPEYGEPLQNSPYKKIRVEGPADLAPIVVGREPHD
jgi:mRNA-degrading endonuclease RelE of RelBE toxin-antitoxin system